MSMFNESKIISIRYLADRAGVSYWKINNRKSEAGRSKTISPLKLSDRTLLANTLEKELTPVFNDLGFNIKITRRRE